MLVCITKKFARNAISQGDIALGSADFVNGIYSWGGDSLTASQVIDQTGWIGASGLAIAAAQPAAAKLLNDFGTQILTCQWTVVLEVEILDDFANAAYILTAQAADPTYFAQIDYAFGEWEIQDEDNVDSRFTFDDAHGISIGIHKIAATRTDDRISLSVDGNAVVTDVSSTLVLPSPGHAMVNPYLGGGATGTGEAINIRSLQIFEPMSDGSLPTLSA